MIAVLVYISAATDIISSAIMVDIQVYFKYPKFVISQIISFFVNSMPVLVLGH